MILTPLDWSIIAVYFLSSLAIGLYYYRRAGSGVGEFFLSGRDLPWWLAGTSMVATTFAADTPLAVTELVARNGIAGNWLWWNFVFGGVLTVFFFARLWRRAGIMTDVELTELRYSGRPAAFLRGFRSLYLGVFMNCVIMAWVNLAMAAILEGMFGIPHDRVMLYVGVNPVSVRWAMDHVRAGAEEAGRDPDAIAFSVLTAMWVSDDQDEAWARCRWAPAACANHTSPNSVPNARSPK